MDAEGDDEEDMQMLYDITTVKSTCGNGHARRAVARIGRIGTSFSRSQMGRSACHRYMSRRTGRGAFVAPVRRVGLDTPRSPSARCRSVRLALRPVEGPGREEGYGTGGSE